MHLSDLCLPEYQYVAGLTDSLGMNFTAANKKMLALVDSGTTTNLTQENFDGFGTQSNPIRYQVKNTTTDHSFWAATSSTLSNWLMSIKGNGVVEIPKVLSLPSGGRKSLTLYDAGTPSDNTLYNFNGLGMQPSQLNYQVNNTGDDHVFYAAISSTVNQELMRIDGATGNVSCTGKFISVNDNDATINGEWVGTSSTLCNIRFIRQGDVVTVRAFQGAWNGSGTSNPVLFSQTAPSWAWPRGFDSITIPATLSIDATTCVGIVIIDPDGRIGVSPSNGQIWSSSLTCAVQSATGSYIKLP